MKGMNNVRSKQTKVKYLLLVLLLIAGSIMALIPASAANQVCEIKWDAERQVIEGFGASGAFGRAGKLMVFPESSRQKILDLLFSVKVGIGLNIVRNLVGDGAAIPSIEPKESQWNWTGDEEQIWLMNEAKKYGVTRFMSTVWSPPAWMKTNDSAINGGELRPDKYRAYAEYLSNYVRGYKEKHGIDIYAISLANEPDYTATYSSCRWTSLQFKEFIKNSLIPVFKKDNIQAKVMMPEQMNFDDAYDYDTLKDPATAAGVDIIGTHCYDFAVREFSMAKSAGKSIWQTEASNLKIVGESIEDAIKFAKLIHDHMTVTELNAWLYWWFVALPDDQGQALINISPDQTYQVFKRLYTIGNFSRFVRPGFIRIETTVKPAPNVFVSAYKDKATGKFAIVAINKGDVDQIVSFKLSDFPELNSVAAYRTSGTENLAKLPPIGISDGLFIASLKSKSVTTFVDRGTGAALPAVTNFVDSGGEPKVKDHGIIKADTKIEAEAFDDQSGVQSEPCAEGGANVGYIENGDYMCFKKIDFGKGFPYFEARVASATAGGKMELRLDSVTGTVIGNLPVTSTGGWQNWISKTCTVKGTTGVHDLYLVFTGEAGYLFNINWFQFKETGEASKDEAPKPTPVPVAVGDNLLNNPGFETGSTEGWYSFGPAAVSAVKDSVQDGKYSAYVFRRTDSWQGIAQSMLSRVEVGKTYLISAWVRLENKASDTVKITVKRADKAGDHYEQAAAGTANNTGWVQITGQYKVTADGKLTGLEVYAEGPAAGVNFYVDSVSVKEAK
jgi:glucuronoarabinoxylan endo-1,4-beta-xylanase